MSRVLVTGASSTIGAKIAIALAHEGHEVVCMSRARDYVPPAGTAVRGDLKEPSSLAKALDGVTIVLHAAAITHTDDENAYFEINVAGTQTLVDKAKSAGVARFVLVSSRAVGSNGGAYAASKSAAEEAVRASSMESVVVRPAEVYGTKKEEGVDRLIEQVLHHRIVPFVAGRAARIAPVFVDDVVAATVRATTRGASAGATYTLAGPDEYTLAEFVDILTRATGRLRVKVPIPPALLSAALFAKRRLHIPVPVTNDQLARLVMPKETDSSRAAAELGFSPIPFTQWLAGRVV
jgi:NADH dehydrogenase